METKPLASFAVNARLKLLDVVESKLSSVLLDDSLARREEPRAVAALEAQISSTSVESVVSEVSYIWFNRLLVLTMLDHIGFNHPRVVMPSKGAVLPEVLQQAKSGVIDLSVNDDSAASRIRGLLSGQIPSNSPDMEAYGILLRDVCRAWGNRFPLVFRSNLEIADLLTPSDLLSNSSIRAMFLKELQGEFLEEVEAIGWLFQFYNSDVKKSAFEKFKSGKKADHQDLVAATQIFTPKSVATVLAQNAIGTLWAQGHPDSAISLQLPAIARNQSEISEPLEPEALTVLDPACGSGNLLLSAYDLLEEMYLETGYNPDSVPALILSNNLHGLDIDPRAAALAAFAIWLRASRNLSKAAALDLPQPKIHFLCDSEALLILAEECDEQETASRLDLAARAGTLGSLVQVTRSDIEYIRETGERQGLLGELLMVLLPGLELLSRKFSAVIANPPYMGPKNMPPLLKDLVETIYPEGKADLYAAFMIRCANLARTDGRFSLVVQLSWAKLQRFAALRRWVISSTREQAFQILDSNVFLGVGGFVEKVVFSASARGSDTARVKFSNSTGEQLRELELSIFSHLEGAPFLFELPPFLIEARDSSNTLGDITKFNSGIKTGENSSFLRYRWEVPNSGDGRDDRGSAKSESAIGRWRPYVKGAGSSRWFSLCIDVIDWENNGARLKTGLREDGSKRNFQLMSESFMFEPFVTYSDISHKAAFRYVPEGHLTDLAAPAIQSPDLFWLLAFMNSSPVRHMVELSNPSLHIKQNDWSGVPVLGEFPQLSVLGRTAYELTRDDLNTLEVSPDFNFTFWRGQHGESLQARLSSVFEARAVTLKRIAEIEQKIDDLVSERYGFPWPDLGELDTDEHSPDPIKTEGQTSLALQHSAILEELLSLGIGIRFGSLANGVRFGDFEDHDNIAPLLESNYFEDDLTDSVPLVLIQAFGLTQKGLITSIESTLGKTLKSWLSKDFYSFHVKMYKNAPIYWMISSPKGHFKALTYIHRLSIDTFATCRTKYVQPLIEKLKSQKGGLGASDPKKAAALEVQIQDISELDDLLYDLILKAPKLDFDEGVVKNHERFAPVLRKLK